MPAPPNHDPSVPWDPVVDYQGMSRNVRGFMSLFHSDKPVVCKVHGFCVAGGTDMALCSDLLVIADEAKPVAVAGVMGGLESEVGAATTDVLLESAIFAPLSVRQTSRALKLSSFGASMS